MAANHTPHPVDGLDAITGVKNCRVSIALRLPREIGDEGQARNGTPGKAVVEERIDLVQLPYNSFKFKAGVDPELLTDAQLAGLGVRTLFLMGEHEKICDPNAAIARLRAVAPTIETELIRSTGHDLLFTHADLVNRRVLAFLE